MSQRGQEEAWVLLLGEERVTLFLPGEQEMVENFCVEELQVQDYEK